MGSSSCKTPQCPLRRQSSRFSCVPPGMGKRRFAQLSASEDEEEEEEEGGESPKKQQQLKKQKGLQQEEESIQAEEEAKPIGEVINVTGKGKWKKKHYASFEYDGNVFALEDSVLLSPAELQKPYVAIIKDITEDIKGNVMVTGQWFYRPEEAEKRGGGCWKARDTRELFYSYHLDEVPAESVMHKCVVHFVPLHKQLPVRSQHPGFIVQKVYDTVQRKLWKLTDKDYEDSKQHEIDLLVEKTRQRIGELPDIVAEDSSAHQDDYLNSKRNLGRKNLLPLDVSRVEPSPRSDQLAKADTPRSCTSDVSKYHGTLAKFKALTGDTYRDKWLEKLLQGTQLICNSKVAVSTEHKQKINAVSSDYKTTDKNGALIVTGSKDNSSDAGVGICWPDAVIPTITTLERVTYEALSIDFQKYNQKMRQLDFNLKNNALLARRLLNKELESIVLLTMTPDELKEGLTADERTTTEPEKTEQMQMTDARCSRCMEKQVGVADIIQAGGHGDRYQLECIACGHTWYASRDAISSLTIDAPNVVGNVGTAPWATAKFEDVEKKLVSPRDSQTHVFQKSTAAYFPVLETQKSFNRSKTEDPSSAARRE